MGVPSLVMIKVEGIPLCVSAFAPQSCSSRLTHGMRVMALNGELIHDHGARLCMKYSDAYE